MKNTQKEDALSPPSVILVGVREKTAPTHAMEELEALCQNVGWHTVKHFHFSQVRHPKSAWPIGKGKLEEIQHYVSDHKISRVVFDQELTPAQTRNMERALHTEVYDRSLVILNIFTLRARSAQAKLQVKLARYQYLLPRLQRRWTHLERQRGRISTRGGAGEKEIETDRRQIQHQITVLKRKLTHIQKQAATQQKRRYNILRVALVGYTNAGKSSLMNALAHTQLLAQNRLFATLDTTVRRVVWENTPLLLSDTVGFIQKIPPDLIESFRSTLLEVHEADLLMHVVNVAAENMEEHIQEVENTLQSVDALHKPKLLLLHKTDLLPTPQTPLLSPHRRRPYKYVLASSIKNKESIENIKKSILAALSSACASASVILFIAKSATFIPL